MTRPLSRLEALAFDTASNWCKCKEGEWCEADAYGKGFIAGFKAARDGIAGMFESESCNSHEDTEECLSVRVRAFGDEPAEEKA